MANVPDSDSADVQSQAEETGEPEIITLTVENETLHTLSVKQRRLGLRIVPYNEIAEHPKYGPLMFEPGAFVASDLGPVDPVKVRLRMDHVDPPTGLGEKFTEMPDAPYMEFGVSKTSRGDDQLTLAADGTSTGASVGYSEVPGKPKQRTIQGQSVRVYPAGSAVLHEVSTTWQPTFAKAGVMYVLHKEAQKGDGPVAEAKEAAETAVAFDSGPLITAIKERNEEQDDRIEKMLGGLVDWQKGIAEQLRGQFQVPGKDETHRHKPKIYEWAEVAARMIAGEHVGQEKIKTLALEDVVSSDNPGLVPDVFRPDFDDQISDSRPFAETLRQVAAPATGFNLPLPKIAQRATAATQSGEKTEVAGGDAPQMDLLLFPSKDVLAGSDISIQMLLRGDASTFDFIVQELGEAWALDFDKKLLDALFNGTVTGANGTAQGNPDSGGTLDPEALEVGGAWQTSISVYRRAPSHIWMNSDAVAKFIDAKAGDGKTPLYSTLAADFTAANGTGGRISGLIPVYVPALDDPTFGADVLIGPARSFVWAQDPALRLQADVPSKAGRDLLLAGTVFAAPRFGDAFTYYTV